MRRAVLAAVLSLVAAPAFAQTPPPPPGPASPGPALIAPRNPSAATAGLTTPNPQHTNSTVQDIGGKLLSQEKDRPKLPGQVPSPSQGGTSTGAISTATHPPRR